MSSAPQFAMVAAADWHSGLPATETLTLDTPSAPLCIRRFVGTSPHMEQPALADDILCLHLGGNKRIHRTHGGRSTSYDVASGALTLMPRQERNRWRTVGPVDFVHLVLDQDQLGRIAVSEFGRERSTFHLGDDVGFRDALLEPLLGELLRIAREGKERCQGRLYVESVITAFTLALLRNRSTITQPPAAERTSARGGLGGWRMRRINEYVDAHFARDIGLDELAGLVGLSRAQFFRAFRQSTGLSPARYLERLRVERARPLIASGEELELVAPLVGLASARQLAAGFQRCLGVSPTQYRRRNR